MTHRIPSADFVLNGHRFLAPRIGALDLDCLEFPEGGTLAPLRFPVFLPAAAKLDGIEYLHTSEYINRIRNGHQFFIGAPSSAFWRLSGPGMF